MWTIEFHERKGRPRPHKGHVGSMGEAMSAFRESWDRGRTPQSDADPPCELRFVLVCSQHLSGPIRG